LKQYRVRKVTGGNYSAAWVESGWRAEGINRRIGLQHVSVFGRPHNDRFERLKHWDCVDIEDELNWASRDACDDDVRELRSVTP
jgi:hypothetical protein